MTPLARLAYGLASGIVVADQALKALVVYGLRLGEVGSVPLLGPVRLSMVWNRGVSFGFLNFDTEWSRWLLSVFAAGVAIGVGVWVRRVDRLALGVALGCIMGGAVGNLIDRVRFGAVADFIDFSHLWFPWVFNLADAAINVGAALLVWDLFLAPRKTAAA